LYSRSRSLRFCTFTFRTEFFPCSSRMCRSRQDRATRAELYWKRAEHLSQWNVQSMKPLLEPKHNVLQRQILEINVLCTEVMLEFSLV
jgi:hypothetical protein